jgi:hypothetical protein
MRLAEVKTWKKPTTSLYMKHPTWVHISGCAHPTFWPPWKLNNQRLWHKWMKWDFKFVPFNAINRDYTCTNFVPHKSHLIESQRIVAQASLTNLSAVAGAFEFSVVVGQGLKIPYLYQCNICLLVHKN